MEIRQMKEKYGTYAIIGLLIVIVVILGVSNISKTNLINTQGQVITQVSEEAENLNIKLESAVADKNKLSSYEDERKELKEDLVRIDNEIKTWQEAKRLNWDLTSDKEKQIRCQRAVVTGLEESSCDEEATYDKYPL